MKQIKLHVFSLSALITVALDGRLQEPIAEKMTTGTQYSGSRATVFPQGLLSLRGMTNSGRKK